MGNSFLTDAVNTFIKTDIINKILIISVFVILFVSVFFKKYKNGILYQNFVGITDGLSFWPKALCYISLSVHSIITWLIAILAFRMCAQAGVMSVALKYIIIFIIFNYVDPVRLYIIDPLQNKNKIL